MSTESLPDDPLTDHSYDGILEYDNPLPGWWKWLFVATVVFAPIYYLYFHAGPESRSIYNQYEREMAATYERKFKTIGILEPDRETLLEYMNDEKWLSFGRVVFQANCVNCHGNKGEGKVGPNLTDNYWKNVTSIEQIAKVIEEGANNGAMPAWGNQFSHPNYVVLVAAYVASLSEDPVPGLPPEGRKIESWE